MPHLSEDGPVDAPTREPISRPTSDPAFDLFKSIIPETKPARPAQTRPAVRSTTTRPTKAAAPARTAEQPQKAPAPHRGAGLTIQRHFTKLGVHPFETVAWVKRTSRITDEKGKIIFEMVDAEVPADWSQLATDIIVNKYFRKAGVPQVDASGQSLTNPDGTPVLGPERSAKQTIRRLAGTWRHWGEHYGYFASTAEAEIFEAELLYMLVHQMGSPNSPQWFNTGLHWAYGITGPAQGHSYVEQATGEFMYSTDAYTRPQPHACQPYHAPISTPQGPIAIGDIVTNAMVGLEIYDGQADGLATTRVVAVKANGEKPVWRITLKNGASIEATPNHLVYATNRRRDNGQWLRVDELRCGMRLQLSTQTIVTKHAPEPLAAEAGLTGWLHGDGFVGQYEKGTNRSLTLEFMTINPEEEEFVTAGTQAVFAGVHAHTRAVASQAPALNIRRHRLYGEVLRPFVDRHNLLERSTERMIPASILSAGREAQAAYLRALFQADGTVRLRARRGSRTADVVLTTISKNLADSVQTLLLNLGIYARVTRGVEKRANRHTPYFVSIGYADARQRFREMIGFISHDKQAKLERGCSAEFAGKQLPGLREEIIVRIEPVGVQPVYDIQTESGQYLSNNVIVHNCFIQSVRDDLVNPGGIMDLATREARIFKYGSGTGTNFSALRGTGEPLSGGGKSSGLMSWLKIFDVAAGSIKSGGTTRRAAKMVILDMDHPDIEKFITWKAREEDKALALIRAGYPADFNGEAYATVSGQNSNNSARVTDDFLTAVETDGEWQLRWRTDPNHVADTVKARDLWQKVAESAWRCADPGVQYDTTINDWHTCPASGRINGSNPCSEYMFLDDTACNLMSLNLMKFYDEEKRALDIPAFRHASRLWTIVLEISVAMAQFPSEPIARKSWEFRTLGLGYANLGTLLMVMGIPYDSDRGRSIAAGITATMTGQAYATSAELAENQGPFPGYEPNIDAMLRVIRNHRRVAKASPDAEFEALHVIPPKIDQPLCPPDLLAAAHETWDQALAWGKKYGYRNAQTTLIAPTGTIGLQMDCDTTGVEPDFALVKFKKLAGGGNFKIVNASVPKALQALGYTPEQVHEIVEYAIGTGTFDNAPGINRQSLTEKGLTDAEIDAVNRELPGVFDLRYAFNPLTVAPTTYERLGLTDKIQQPSFDFLRALGFTDGQIEEANKVICGRMTVESAPHLREEHLPVFDCANRCGRYGTRFLRSGAHLDMMGAVQPFLSGSISKTVNMPNEATVADVRNAYEEGWRLALKSVALYRDGSKGSQPLSTSVQESEGTAAQTEKAQSRTATTDVEAGARMVETKIEYRPFRRRLPDERQSLTHKFSIAGHEGYITVGLYNDGTPGELFIKMSKQGSILAGLMDAFAISVSLAMQYGVPLAALVNKFSHVRFEPSGFTKNSQIPIAKSVIDYLFRYLGVKFLPREEWARIGIHVDDQPESLTDQVIEDLGPATAAPTPVTSHAVDESSQMTLSFDPSKQAKLAFDIQGDAPACDTCGGIMVRSGTCYKCLGCGATSGCS